MKIRNILLSAALLFSGIANAQEVTAPEVSKTQVYKEEFEQIKENHKYENLFNKDVALVFHNLERQIQNYEAIPNRWHRFASFVFLQNDVIVVTQKNMPQLHSFIEQLAEKANIQTPIIFISIREGIFNAFAAKILKGIGGILLDQKMLNELADKQLEAIIAHEMGHIKYEHVNKALAVIFPTFFVSLYLSHKLMDFAKSKLPDHKIANWAYWGVGRLRYLGFHEYSMGLLSAGITAYLAKSLVIGKNHEKQADAFACQMGYAQELIETMQIFEQKNQLADLQLAAVNDKLMAEQENLTPQDFNELKQQVEGTKAWLSFSRWIQEKTPLESHPSNADRIAAAQAYLDAQAAEQVPAIEKA